MKKISILFATIVMVLLFAFSASALYSTGQCGDNVRWSFNRSTGELIIKGQGEMWSDFDKFMNDDTIKTVVIENGVTEINNCFLFLECENLTSISIPASVTYIDSVSYCDNLVSITVDENNENYTVENGVLFNKDKTELLRFPAGSHIGKYTIPDSVRYIGWRAFADAKNLVRVTMPDGLYDIGQSAFESCKNLIELKIPDSVNYIGSSAFAYCDSIISVEIPEKVWRIHSRAFECCSALRSVTIPASVHTIDERAFANCKSLESITVDENNENYSSQDGVLFNKDKTILMQHPAGNDRKEYAIPDTVESLAAEAFDYCSTLESIFIPDSVIDMIYSDMVYKLEFYECVNLKNIVVDENNKYYSSQDGVLFNKNKTELLQYPTGSSRTSYKIPDGVRKIKIKAFINADNLKELTVPVTVTEIDTTYSISYLEGIITDIYYEGTKSQWQNIGNFYNNSIHPGGVYLDEIFLHFNSADYTHNKSTVVTPPTCTAGGYTTCSCNCGGSYTYDYVSTVPHSIVASTVVPPACESFGYTIYACENCSYFYESDWTSTTGHNYGDDYVCKDCGENKSDNCSCNCHKGGFSGFIWKILRIFYKIFKTNPVCECGVKHY